MVCLFALPFVLKFIFINALTYFFTRLQSCAESGRCGCSLLPLLMAQMDDVWVQLLLAATLWMMPHTGAVPAAVLPPGSTELLNMTGAGAQTDSRMLTGAVSAPCSRQKRALSDGEINALLDYHNRVRSQVFPPAANMELMVRKHCAVKWTNNN